MIPRSNRSLLRPTFAALTVALGAAFAAPVQAQFAERTIRVSNGVNQDHPVGNGVAKMTACVTQKSAGKMKLQAFWGGALEVTCRRPRPCARALRKW